MPPIATNNSAADFEAARMITTLPVKMPVIELVIRTARAGYTAAQDVRRKQLIDPPIDEIFNEYRFDPRRSLRLLDDQRAVDTDTEAVGPAPIDDLPHPYRSDVAFATHVLESIDAEDRFAIAVVQGGHIGDPARVADMVAYDACRSAVEAFDPSITSLGEEDELTPEERGQQLGQIVAESRSWTITDAIDGTLGYRRTFSKEVWCTAVMGQYGGVFATCITTEAITLVSVGDECAMYWTEGGWRLLQAKSDSDATDGFGLIVPAMKLKDRQKYAPILTNPIVKHLYGFSGNPAILGDLLLGYVNAALQPSCMAWDIIVAHPAAIAGHEVTRLDTNELLDATAVRELLINTLIDGVKMPDIAVARDTTSTQTLVALLDQSLVNKTA